MVEEEQIEELRKAFLKELDERGQDAAHPKDLERVKTDNKWLKRFLMHHDGDQKEALNMLWESIIWRKEFKANEIRDIVRMDLIVQGGFFPHGKDKDGCSIFVFKCKKYIKGANPSEDLKRCLVYWFERLERQDDGQSITLFFDMEGCGLANLDMEFIQYLIGLFKKYYPYFLNYILIFEMPWILSAAFKVIKSWLPEKAVQKIKQISKKDIQTYVPLDQALVCWGGNNDYTFSFVQETLENGFNSNMTSTPYQSNRKVHFADGAPMSEPEHNFGDNKITNDGSGIIVEPSDTINFIKEGQELVSTLELKNVDPHKIYSYKLKTTSPEKFRVRPSMGCLMPGVKATVHVSLLPGFQIRGLTRDKFLVMSTLIEENEMTMEMSQLWKDTSGRKVYQHRLLCSQSSNEMPNNGSIASVASTNNSDVNQNQINQLVGKINKLLDKQNEIDGALKRTQYTQYFIVFLMILVGLLLTYMIFIRGFKDLNDNDQMFCRSPDTP